MFLVFSSTALGTVAPLAAVTAITVAAAAFAWLALFGVWLLGCARLVLCRVGVGAEGLHLSRHVDGTWRCVCTHLCSHRRISLWVVVALTATDVAATTAFAALTTAFTAAFRVAGLTLRCTVRVHCGSHGCLVGQCQVLLDSVALDPFTTGFAGFSAWLTTFATAYGTFAATAT